MQSTGNIIGNDKCITLKQIEDKALSGDPDAMFDLACIYHSGNIKGVGLDYHKAYHWCKKAVELGHANAVFHMGLLHESGEGVEKKDLRMACECYRNAAKSGHAGAMFHLAKWDMREPCSIWRSAMKMVAAYIWMVMKLKDGERKRKLSDMSMIRE